MREAQRFSQLCFMQLSCIDKLNIWLKCEVCCSEWRAQEWFKDIKMAWYQFKVFHEIKQLDSKMKMKTKGC